MRFEYAELELAQSSRFSPCQCNVRSSIRWFLRLEVDEGGKGKTEKRIFRNQRRNVFILCNIITRSVTTRGINRCEICVPTVWHRLTRLRYCYVDLLLLFRVMIPINVVLTLCVVLSSDVPWFDGTANVVEKKKSNVKTAKPKGQNACTRRIR